MEGKSPANDDGNTTGEAGESHAKLDDENNGGNQPSTRYFVYEADGEEKKFLETPPDDGTAYYALSSDGQICYFGYESDEDENVEFYYFDENDVQIDLESAPDGSFSYYMYRPDDQTYWYWDHTTGEISMVDGESDRNSAPALEPDDNPTPPPAIDQDDNPTPSPVPEKDDNPTPPPAPEKDDNPISATEFYYFDENDVQIDLESAPDGSFSYYMYRPDDQTHWYWDHTTGEISMVNGESDRNSAPALEPDDNPTPSPAPDTIDSIVSTLNPQVAEFIPWGLETPTAPKCPCGGDHGTSHSFAQKVKTDGKWDCKCCVGSCYDCDCCNEAPFHYRCIKCV